MTTRPEPEGVSWRIAGTYLEACNCEAICPCRTIDGRKGGRSTEGVCTGALSWQIDEGTAGEENLAGLRVVLALRYDDDEPGSPWDFFLYLDERADGAQRAALEAIFLGRLGGTPATQFPWVWKESRMLGVHPVAIEVDHTPGHGWFRAGGHPRPPSVGSGGGCRSIGGCRPPARVRAERQVRL